jgi:hypothetical protein
MSGGFGPAQLAQSCPLDGGVGRQERHFQLTFARHTLCPPRLGLAANLRLWLEAHKPWLEGLPRRALRLCKPAHAPSTTTQAGLCMRPAAHRLPSAGRQRTDGPRKPWNAATLPSAALPGHAALPWLNDDRALATVALLPADWCPTFDMSGGLPTAQPAVRRPLDGGVRCEARHAVDFQP